MARSRNIKPGLYLNEDLAECSISARFLFTALWTMADRQGRLEDRPKRIKLGSFPYDDGVDVDGLLSELEQWRFIVRYEVDGLRLISVCNFEKHQNPHKDEKARDLPPPPTQHHTSTMQVRCKCGTSAEAARLIPDSLLLIPDSKISLELQSNSKPPEDPPTEFSFPTVGKPKGDWTLPQSLLAEYSEAYPSLDVKSELRAAKAWLVSNKAKRKTHRGMPTFLNGWLSRTQNRRGGGRSVVPVEQTRVRDPTRDAERARSAVVKQMRREGGPIDEAEVERRLAEV